MVDRKRRRHPKRAAQEAPARQQVASAGTTLVVVRGSERRSFDEKKVRTTDRTVSQLAARTQVLRGEGAAMQGRSDASQEAVCTRRPRVGGEWRICRDVPLTSLVASRRPVPWGSQLAVSASSNNFRRFQPVLVSS